jgi:preprotein translocase subunit SecG
MTHMILLASFWHIFFGIVLTTTAIFLILLVLVQRGRGGGLAGAFGGMGGQSAFGTKAGDTFTRITIGISLFWILMCIASVKFLGNPSSVFESGPSATQVVPGPSASPEETTPPPRAEASGPEEMALPSGPITETAPQGSEAPPPAPEQN